MYTGGSTCPPGQVYDECAIDCVNLCTFYSYIVLEKGMCKNNTQCQAGCVSALKKMSCPAGNKWADDHTCIKEHDCVCTTPSGIPVKVYFMLPARSLQKMLTLSLLAWYGLQARWLRNLPVHRQRAYLRRQCVHWRPHLVGWKRPWRQNRWRSGNHIPARVFRKRNARSYRDVHHDATTAMQRRLVSSRSSINCFNVRIIVFFRYLDLIQGDQPLPDDAFSASSSLGKAYAPYNARFGTNKTEKSGGYFILLIYFFNFFITKDRIVWQKQVGKSTIKSTLF